MLRFTLQSHHVQPASRARLTLMMERMMGATQRITLLGAALTLVAACASQPITVGYNPDTGFSRFRTFAMVSRPDSASPKLIDDGMRNAIERQLEAKGLRDTTLFTKFPPSTQG